MYFFYSSYYVKRGLVGLASTQGVVVLASISWGGLPPAFHLLFGGMPPGAGLPPGCPGRWSK